VRVSSPTQADLVTALGAKPVLTGFAQIVANFQAGNLDCAITGSMSGHTIGLYRHTTHLYPLPINWGLSAFVVNQASWDGFPADLQQLLLTHLPDLEARIWAESLRETDLGIACNAGQPACPEIEKGRMTVVSVHANDPALLRRLFAEHVVPAWQARCGATCAALARDIMALP
jgi:TRAP-type C4-dicarboxylate transport system substrate-binding protein